MTDTITPGGTGDWSSQFDSSGKTLAAQAPSIAETSEAMAKGLPATREQTEGLGFDVAPTAPAPDGRNAVVKKGIDGIARADWDKPRNESGQYITATQAGLRETFQREGGFKLNRDRVLAAESSYISMSENPAELQAALGELPESIQIKAANIMRLSAGYRDAGAAKWLQFEDSLTAAELQTFMKVWRELKQSDRDAIELAMSTR